MKFLWILLIAFFSTSKVYSQNCKEIDFKSFYQGIKFGTQIPVELASCSNKIKTDYTHSFELRILYDSLNQSCKKKYAKLFTFLSVPFKIAQITTNNQGQIAIVNLYSFFEDKSSYDAAISKLPANYTKIYNKLTSLYGIPVSVEEPSNLDTILVKEKGLRRTVEWECNNIILEMRVCYGSRNKDLNIISIAMRNRNFEEPPMLEKLLQ